MGLLDKLLNRKELDKLNVRQLERERERYNEEVIRLNNQIGYLEREKHGLHALATDPTRNLTDRQRLQVVRDLKAKDTQISALSANSTEARNRINLLDQLIIEKQALNLRPTFDSSRLAGEMDDYAAQRQLQRDKDRALGEALGSVNTDPLNDASDDELELLQQLEREKQIRASAMPQVNVNPPVQEPPRRPMPEKPSPYNE